MTRSIDSYALRMVTVAGFLVMATLVAPEATHGQTSSPKRASLSTPAFFSDSRVIVAAKPTRTADGESALLGQSAVDVMRQPTMGAGTPGEARGVDGEQALLNKATSSDTLRNTNKP